MGFRPPVVVAGLSFFSTGALMSLLDTFVAGSKITGEIPLTAGVSPPPIDLFPLGLGFTTGCLTAVVGFFSSFSDFSSYFFPSTFFAVFGSALGSLCSDDFLRSPFTVTGLGSYSETLLIPAINM